MPFANIHPGFNALYDIDCGGDPYGVFRMIHTEGLHVPLRLAVWNICWKFFLTN
jgi:hypothetical protein